MRRGSSLLVSPGTNYVNGIYLFLMLMVRKDNLPESVILAPLSLSGNYFILAVVPGTVQAQSLRRYTEFAGVLEPLSINHRL